MDAYFSTFIDAIINSNSNPDRRRVLRSATEDRASRAMKHLKHVHHHQTARERHKARTAHWEHAALEDAFVASNPLDLGVYDRAVAALEQRAEVGLEGALPADERRDIGAVQVLVDAWDELQLAGEPRQNLRRHGLAEPAVQPHELGVPPAHDDAPAEEAAGDRRRRAELRRGGGVVSSVCGVAKPVAASDMVATRRWRLSASPTRASGGRSPAR